jgi:Xaa-Pro aminopeptidase
LGAAWTTLQPGMTLTVEPGLYIRPGPDIPAALGGIGIRIEDDVRVTVDGCQVFTTAPKTIAAIEETMRHE